MIKVERFYDENLLNVFIEKNQIKRADIISVVYVENSFYSISLSYFSESERSEHAS